VNTKSIIIGVVVIVIGGVILLNIEYSFFVGKKNLSKEAEKLVEEISEKPPAKDPLSFVEKDLGVLETMLKAASSINVYQQRNEEYVRLVKLGLKENKPGFAFQVASKINVYQIRNEQYIAIITHALENNNLALAYAVAESIDVYQIRNSEYKRIIDKGLEMRAKTSSEKIN
jgi:hypothetical protein